jgi:WhiB family redox-sensing transcriptional regulator
MAQDAQDGQASGGLSRGSLRAYTHLWDWQLNANCRYLGWETFFGTGDESTGARIRREQSARAICAQCLVRSECRDHALRIGESFGIWGGTSAIERSRLRRRNERP